MLTNYIDISIVALTRSERRSRYSETEITVYNFTVVIVKIK